MGSRLLIVIVNYRTPGLTIDCLASLEPTVAADPDLRVVVTDNLSGDDSVARIGDAVRSRGWERWCRLMPLDRNGGFSAGNNAAIKPDLESDHPADLYLLLNPDTIVRPGAIENLKNFMDVHPDVGIAGARLEGPDGTPQIAAFRFLTAGREFTQYLRLGVWEKLFPRSVVRVPTPEEPIAVDWVSGASLMVRREVLQKIGLLDEAYFLYFDEVDFCLRARRAGFSCWLVPQSRIVHLAEQATQMSGKQTARRRPDYWFNSRRHYFVKNFGLFGAALADAAAIGGLTLGILHTGLRGKHANRPPRFLYDLVRHSVFVRGGRGI